MLISRGMQAIITDFRYTEQAGQEAPGFQTLGIEGAVSHLQKAYEACKRERRPDRLLRGRRVHRARLEKRRWRSSQGMELKPLGDGIEQLRRIKDAEEIRRVERACSDLRRDL